MFVLIVYASYLIHGLIFLSVMGKLLFVACVIVSRDSLSLVVWYWVSFFAILAFLFVVIQTNCF